MADSYYDVVVIGGGPNGLTAASYLANSGAKVLLLERSHDVGGGIGSEQLAGFTINKYSIHFILGQDMPPYRDLKLDEYGARFVKPEVPLSLIYKANKSLTFYSDAGRTERSIAKLSQNDVRRFSKLYSDLKECFEKVFVPSSYLQPKPSQELEGSLTKTEEGRRFLKWSNQSPLKTLEEYGLETEELKAALLLVGCMWGLQPKLEGLGHLFAACTYGTLNSSVVLGGSGTLAFTLMASGVRRGLTIREYVEVSKILVENGMVKGVTTRDGNRVECKAVVSTVDPVSTFLKFVGEDKLDAAIIAATQQWRWDPWSYFTIQLGLRERPRLEAADTDSDCQRACLQVFGYDSLNKVVRHFDSASSNNLNLEGFSVTPMTEVDPAQAPPGHHLYKFTTEVPFEVEGKNWAVEKDRYAEKILDSWADHISNRDSIRVVKKYVYPPTYIETAFPNMPRGSINQGALIPSQLGHHRPNAVSSGCSTNIQGLYVAGASVHPGGPVMLAQGHIVAKKVAEYLGLQVLWPEPDYIQRFLERYGG